MEKQFTGLIGCALLAAAANASAAPVTYSFTTGPSAFVGGTSAGASVPSLFSSGGVSGTFVYDSSAQVVQVQGNGTVYRGFTPESVTGFPSSLTALSGTVGAFAFSDVSGSTFVSNDRFSTTGFVNLTNVDQLTLNFDPGTGGTAIRNLTGFQVDGYTLVSVRMQWLEGIGTTSEPFDPGFTSSNGGPALGDFLSDESLPAALPSQAARLWLDFYKTDDPGITSFAFFNNLHVSPVAAIPEPESYAMLLAGLALMGFVVRRRRGAGDRA